MPLNKLGRELERHDSDLVDRPHDKTVYNEWLSEKTEKKQSTWGAFIDDLKHVRLKAVVLGIIIIATIVFVLGMVSYVVFYQNSFFAPDKVHHHMQVAPSVDSNTVTQIVFTYKNDNRATLENAEIVVDFGQYFVPSDNQRQFTKISDTRGVIAVGEIAGHTDGEVALVGHFAGARNEVANVTGSLQYTVQKRQETHTVNANASTTITSSPCNINVEAPQKVVRGNIIDITFVVQNTGMEDIADAQLQLTLPRTFILHDAQPKINTTENTWHINTLAAQQERVFHVRGVINADVGTVQNFSAVLTKSGSDTEYARVAYAPRMIQSLVAVSQNVTTESKKSVVYAGETVRYDVVFTNKSDKALDDAILTVNLKGDAIDWATLDLTGKGYYDQKNHRIIWKASDIPVLKSLGVNESGSAQFSFDIREQLPVRTEKDYHFFITSVASLDSTSLSSTVRENASILSDTKKIPVGAKVLFRSDIAHHAGAKPPEVGQKSTYTVTMYVESINNDITDAVVRTALPTGVTFEKSNTTDITYNERTNEIMWRVGAVQHGTGVTRDAMEASFVIGFVPSIDQVGIVPVLVKKQTLDATDIFAHDDIRVSVENKTLRHVGEDIRIQP